MKVQEKIKKEFESPLNLILKNEFSNLEFGDNIFFSNVFNIKLGEDGKCSFDITVPYRKYFIRCVCEISKEVHITSIEYLPGVSVYLNVISRDLTYDQLSAKLPMAPTGGWSIGDPFKNGKLSRTFSSVKYNASFDDYAPVDIALERFISALTPNAPEINELSRVADVKLTAASWSHISKVDGLILCQKTFNEMSQLGIGLDYDPYVYED